MKSFCVIPVLLASHCPLSSKWQRKKEMEGRRGIQDQQLARLKLVGSWKTLLLACCGEKPHIQVQGTHLGCFMLSTIQCTTPLLKRATLKVISKPNLPSEKLMASKDGYFWPDIASQRRFLDKTAKELHIKTVTFFIPTSSPLM